MQHEGTLRLEGHQDCIGNVIAPHESRLHSKHRLNWASVLLEQLPLKKCPKPYGVAIRGDEAIGPDGDGSGLRTTDYSARRFASSRLRIEPQHLGVFPG